MDSETAHHRFTVRKPSPWGEGAPVRTLGRMRGRSIGPTGRKKEGVGATGRSFYKERLGTGSPPHPSPSVTASPKGKPSQVVHLHNEMLSPPTPTPAKCESKSGHIDGPRNRPTTAPLRPTTPKRASGNERALKKGGAGGHPPGLFASGLSLEKAWIPARDRAGTHHAGPNLRRSKNEPPADSSRQARPPGAAGCGPPRRCVTCHNPSL